MTRTTLIAALAAAVALLTLAPPAPAGTGGVRLWTIRYTSHDGRSRSATLVLPARYGPDHAPAIPLVVSPHGRGVPGLANAARYGDLPARGGFAVVSPDGMGRTLTLYSYGYSGQIDDLARMPEILEHALPWLRIDHRRIYAVGSSMGGEETLLLVARHPELFAGAVSMDAVVDLSMRYAEMATQPDLQASLRREVGGTPEEQPAAYAARSPLRQAASLARSRVPLQLWWSRTDEVIPSQSVESRALLSAIAAVDPCAAVVGYEGTWPHSHDMRADTYLPAALARPGLLPRDEEDTVRTPTPILAACDA